MCCPRPFPPIFRLGFFSVTTIIIFDEHHGYRTAQAPLLACSIIPLQSLCSPIRPAAGYHIEYIPSWANTSSPSCRIRVCRGGHTRNNLCPILHQRLPCTGGCRTPAHARKEEQVEEEIRHGHSSLQLGRKLRALCNHTLHSFFAVLARRCLNPRRDAQVLSLFLGRGQNRAKRHEGPVENL